MPRAFTLSVSLRLAPAALVMLAVTVALAAPAAFAQGPGESPRGSSGSPRVTVAVLPAGTSVHHLSVIDGLAVGVMSAGLGDVVPDQTYLDMSQGARAFNSLYDRTLPLALPRGERVPKWGEIRERAASAPGDITPGLLATTLRLKLRVKERAIPIESEPELGLPALIGATVRGRVARSYDPCALRRCKPPVLIRNALLRELRVLVARLREHDLLIAFARPREKDLLPIGIAGAGFEGSLTSPATRTDGYVLSTDIAPTILDRLGVAAPDRMTGRAIGSNPDGRSAGAIVSHAQRMEEVSERRGPVITTSVLIWLALALAAAAHPRTRLHGLRLLALTGVYLPFMLLVTAALTPSLDAERAIVAAGAPLLALVTWLAFRGWRAFGVACAVTVAAHALDLIFGSPLISVSLMGPNPALGVRFYGIGNELGAALAMLTLLGIGALLAGFAPRADRRVAAAAFIIVAVGFAGVFAAGRFGADVGSAVVLPASGVVAAALVLSRPLLALAALAVPVVAVAALALLDLATGGDSHFRREVLESSGSGELFDTLGRRLELTGRSFVRAASGPFLPLTVIIGGLGFSYRHTIREWIEAAPSAFGAAFAAAIFASVLGTLANDSGVLLLEVGAAYLLLATGYAWCESRRAGEH